MSCLSIPTVFLNLIKEWECLFALHQRDQLEGVLLRHDDVHVVVPGQGTGIVVETHEASPEQKVPEGMAAFRMSCTVDRFWP